MKKIKNAGIALIMITVTLFMTCCSLFVDPTADDPSTYVFPGETLPHEGTWITWPHNKSNKQKYYFGDVGIDGDVIYRLALKTQYGLIGTGSDVKIDETVIKPL